jgi:hypothetical protein
VVTDPHRVEPSVHRFDRVARPDHPFERDRPFVPLLAQPLGVVPVEGRVERVADERDLLASVLK